MKKYLAIILAAIMLLSLFAACGETTQNPEEQTAQEPESEVPEVYGRFRKSFTVAPPTLNPYTSNDVEANDIINFTQASMYSDKATEDGNGWEWINLLAESEPQQMDEDGKVWRIKMREGLKWANGEKLDANDYIYSFKQKIDPKQLNVTATNIINTPLFSLVNGEAYHKGECAWEDVGVKQLDDLTVEFTSEVSVPAINVKRFSDQITLVYEPLYEAGMNEDRTMTDYGTTVDKYMSCGAFMLTEWIPDAKFTLERNPNYAIADEIHLEGMDITIVADKQTAIELFIQGKLDYCDIAYTDWEQFEDDPRVHEYFNDSLMYMMINLGNPNQNNLLGNLDFRKALYYGIDRNEIANTLGVYPATRLIRRSVIGDSNTLTPFVDLPQDYVLSAEESYNPTLANEYLAKAYEACGLEKASEQILLSETATHIKAATEILQKQYPTVFDNKLDITIRQMPAAQAQTARRWNPDDPTGFDIALGSLLPGATDCRLSFMYYTSDYNPPRVKWSNAEYDKLYAESQTFDLYKDVDEIVARCQAMEKLLLDDLVVNPVYERPEKVLFADNVHLPVNNYVVGFGFGERYATMTPVQ